MPEPTTHVMPSVITMTDKDGDKFLVRKTAGPGLGYAATLDARGGGGGDWVEVYITAEQVEALIEFLETLR